MDTVCLLNYFIKENTVNLNFFQQRVDEDRNGSKNFCW